MPDLHLPKQLLGVIHLYGLSSAKGAGPHELGQLSDGPLYKGRGRGIFGPQMQLDQYLASLSKTSCKHSSDNEQTGIDITVQPTIQGA